MFRADFRIPESQTHEFATEIVHSAKTFTRMAGGYVCSPDYSSNFDTILPSISRLNQELSRACVDTIVHNADGRTDYEIAAQNAVDHAVQASGVSGEGGEFYLHQFTSGCRATRASVARLPYDPRSMDYLEQYGLRPAAEAFSQKPIEVLEHIEELLGSEKVSKEEKRFLEGHRDGYYNRWGSASLLYVMEHTDLRDVVRRIGCSRTHEILAGSPVAKAKKALVDVTKARYQVLRSKAYPVFINKMDKAIVRSDMAWEAQQKADLLKDGTSKEEADRMLPRLIESRKQGIAALQSMDALHTTGRRVIAEINEHTTDSLFSAIAKINHHTDRSIQDATNSMIDALNDLSLDLRSLSSGMSEHFRVTYRALQETIKQIAQASDQGTRERLQRQFEQQNSQMRQLLLEAPKSSKQDSTQTLKKMNLLSKIVKNVVTTGLRVGKTIFGIPSFS